MSFSLGNLLTFGFRIPAVSPSDTWTFMVKPRQVPGLLPERYAFLRSVCETGAAAQSSCPAVAASAGAWVQLVPGARSDPLRFVPLAGRHENTHTNRPGPGVWIKRTH